jgi:hypothetical protein
VATRWLLISILVAALVSMSALSRVDDVADLAGRWTPSIIGLLLLLLALVGSRIAWAVSFVIAAFAAGLQIVAALTALDVPERTAVAGVSLVFVLALWGLRPEASARGHHG